MKKIIIATGLLASTVFLSCKPEKQKAMELISGNEQKLFNDTTKMLNPSIASKEIEDYKNFAKKYPDDTLTPQYLFRAADLCTGMHKPSDAVNIYELFLTKYPNHPKAATGLFMEAFVFDNSLHQKDKATEKYKAFISKYPDHQLVPSAKAALEQLEMGLTDEQLIKMFEAKQDSLAKAGK